MASLDMLEETPVLLRRQIQRAFQAVQGSTTDLTAVMRRLHEGLRNSLHVSTIATLAEIEVNHTDDGTVKLTQKLLDSLETARSASAVPLSARDVRRDARVPPRRKTSASSGRAIDARTIATFSFGQRE